MSPPQLLGTVRREKSDVSCVTTLTGWKRMRCIITVKMNFWERGTPLARDPSTQGREPVSTHSCWWQWGLQCCVAPDLSYGCSTSIASGFPFLGWSSDFWSISGGQQWCRRWKCILRKDAPEECWDPGRRKGLGVRLHLGYCLPVGALFLLQVPPHVRHSCPQNQRSAMSSAWGRAPCDVHDNLISVCSGFSCSVVLWVVPHRVPERVWGGAAKKRSSSKTQGPTQCLWERLSRRNEHFGGHFSTHVAPVMAESTWGWFFLHMTLLGSSFLVAAPHAAFHQVPQASVAWKYWLSVMGTYGHISVSKHLCQVSFWTGQTPKWP